MRGRLGCLGQARTEMEVAFRCSSEPMDSTAQAGENSNNGEVKLVQVPCRLFVQCWANECKQSRMD